MMQVVVVVCILLVAASATTLGPHTALFVLKSFTSTGSSPSCSKYLETVVELPQKNANVAMWCTQTATSAVNYLFVFVNASAFQIVAFGPNDANCTGSPVAQQVVRAGTCFHLLLDNPVVSYNATIVNGGCPASSCSGSATCCWSPTGNQCAPVASGCCCPDYQNVCGSNESCLCGGECPGPSCQCVGCGSQSEGICMNK